MTLTIKEKAKAVRNYCSGRTCSECVLKGVCVNEADKQCIPFDEATDADYQKAYELISKNGVDGNCLHCYYTDKHEHEVPCRICVHGIPYSDPKHDIAPSYWKPEEPDVDWLAELGEPKPTDDVVNHPSHYCQSGIECIDEMILVFGKETVANFCLCNVWKYRKRALLKNGQEDMDKADWYMNKFKELIESDWK